MGDNIVVFGNNKDICQKIISKLTQTGAVATLSLSVFGYSEAEIQKVASSISGKTLVLVFKNDELKNITEAFHHLKIYTLSVCPWDTHYSDEKSLTDLIIPIDNSKPRLDYVEIEISNKCNLNCKGCSEFSNLVCEKKQVDHNSFKQDLEKLKGFFWGIGKIRLLGGEPLTNPDYLSFVKTAREIYPDTDLRLVTNGLLIPTLSKKELDEIKKNNCSFDISNYPPTRKMIKPIKKQLRQSAVAYNISVPIKVFFKLYLPEPLDSPNESYNNCLFTHCHALGNGYLSACSHQFWVHRLNTAFDLSYPVDEKIDIHNTSLTGWEINELFNKPLDFCRYCPKGMVPFKWETCKQSDAKPNNWIAKNSFLTSRVFPITQKTFKFLSQKLRRSVQHPKNRD